MNDKEASLHMFEANNRLNELKIAYQQMMLYRQSVENEMTDKARQMLLWSNNRCAHWNKYTDAAERFHDLCFRYLMNPVVNDTTDVNRCRT